MIYYSENAVTKLFDYISIFFADSSSLWETKVNYIQDLIINLNNWIFFGVNYNFGYHTILVILLGSEMYHLSSDMLTYG